MNEEVGVKFIVFKKREKFIGGKSRIITEMIESRDSLIAAKAVINNRVSNFNGKKFDYYVAEYDYSSYIPVKLNEYET